MKILICRFVSHNRNGEPRFGAKMRVKEKNKYYEYYKGFMQRPKDFSSSASWWKPVKEEEIK